MLNTSLKLKVGLKERGSFILITKRWRSEKSYIQKRNTTYKILNVGVGSERERLSRYGVTSCYSVLNIRYKKSPKGEASTDIHSWRSRTHLSSNNKNKKKGKSNLRSTHQKCLQENKSKASWVVSSMSKQKMCGINSIFFLFSFFFSNLSWLSSVHSCFPAVFPLSCPER